ncbi:MAG: hypothetical protein NT118_02130 [Lentisphaerae bacterium]|nr:hypothetical protein [Lentisphaerota bacterium]
MKLHALVFLFFSTAALLAGTSPEPVIRIDPLSRELILTVSKKGITPEESGDAIIYKLPKEFGETEKLKNGTIIVKAKLAPDKARKQVMFYLFDSDKKHKNFFLAAALINLNEQHIDYSLYLSGTQIQQVSSAKTLLQGSAAHVWAATWSLSMENVNFYIDGEKLQRPLNFSGENLPCSWKYSAFESPVLQLDKCVEYEKLLVFSEELTEAEIKQIFRESNP